MIKLRPHHALCIQFFCGNGYSKDFVDNMNRLIQSLKTNPQIEVTFSKDSVCNCCPNSENGCCNSQCNVENKDKNVAEICSFSNGEICSADYFFGSAKVNIIQSGLRKKVCGECQWNNICIEQQKLLDFS
ncbi:MAG: DUF1284 domain-containing protein [Oscillospiraceae bacterium]